MKVMLPIISEEKKVIHFITQSVHDSKQRPVWMSDRYGAYVIWPTETRTLLQDESTGLLKVPTVYKGFIATEPSNVKGVHGNTVNSCNQCRVEVTPTISVDDMESFLPLEDHILGPYEWNGWCAFEQIIVEKGGEGFWTLQGQPGVVITSRANLLWITHWVREANGQIAGYQWFNGYGGFNYYWKHDGKWVTTIEGVEYTLPLRSPPNVKTKGSRQYTKRLYRRTSTWSYPDLSSLDPEIFFWAKQPYLEALLQRHLPAVCRRAWNNFKLYNSNILVECLDSLFTVSSLRDLIPSSVFDSFRDAAKTTSKWKFINGKWMKPVKGSWQAVSNTELLSNGLTMKQLCQTVAAGRLEYSYGIKLPMATLSNLYAEDTDELWAMALRSHFNSNFREGLVQNLYDPVLRHRDNYGDYKVSCSIQQRLDPDYLFVEYWKALYQSGVLMNFEGIWDLIPLSFCIDWLTGLVKGIAEWFDATTIQQMVRVEQYSYSIKYEDRLEIITDAGDSVGRVKFYIRTYTTTPPATGIDYKDLLPNFRSKFLPEAGSILYLLSN
jgi:hypothetical protein